MLKRSGLTRLQVYGLLLTLLLLAYGLMLSSAGRKSPTVDEQSHLFRGVAYLQEGATHFLLGHPLGASILAALPLLTEPELTLPLETPAWADGNWSVTGGLFFWQSGNDPHRLIFLGRLPMIWLTLLLGGLLFHWGRLLVGPRAGLMAAALILLDPNLLAHGRLITGDVVLTFFFTLALYAFWQHLRQGRWSGLLLLGLALGLAAAVKYNAVLLLPIMGIWALAVAGQRRSPRLLAELVGAGLIAWLIVWVVYRFSLQPLPGGAFWDDLLWQLTYQEQTHGAYLWGDYSATGWWYYFPIAFLLKTPLLHLLLLFGGIAVCLKRGRRAAVFSTSLFLLWGALLYLAFSMGMGLNIGYRYLIPLLPLLWLFVAVTLVDWRDSARFGPPSLTQASGNRPIRPERVFWLQVVIVITALVLLWTPLTWWPDYIPYFNQLAGRADSRWRLLSDSNIDWGQDLPALAAWQQETGQPLKLSYFGTAYPSAYGLEFEPLPTWAPGPEQMRPDWQLYNPARPAPGYYAISVTNLHGVVLGEGRESFAYFRERTPLARIGDSIFVYEVEADGPPLDIALSGLRPSTLDPAIQQIGPGNDWRVRLFDASTAVLWSPGGIWVARPAEQVPPDPLRPFWPDAAEVTAVSQHLYRIDPALPDWADQSVAFAEVLTFLGAQQLATDADRVELMTLWRVEAATERPLQLFIHALDDTGQIAGQWDGLDVVPHFWSRGDLFVQFHTFSVTGLTDTLSLALGVYDAETGQRLGEPLFISE